jgi:hypothetical protein
LARGKPAEDMRKAADAMRRGAGGADGAGPRGGGSRRSCGGHAVADGPSGWAARAADAMRRGSSDQLAGLRQARQRAEAAEAALRDAVQRAMKAAEARKANGGRPDPAADAQARAEIGRLQGEFDRALNEARRLAQRDGAPEARRARQRSGRPGGERRQGGYAGRARRQRAAAAGGAPVTLARRPPGRRLRRLRDPGRAGVQPLGAGHRGVQAGLRPLGSLSKNVKDALEDLESSLADRLSDQRARDRVTAGEDDRAPALYEDAVSRYYRSIRATAGTVAFMGDVT